MAKKKSKFSQYAKKIGLSIGAALMGLSAVTATTVRAETTTFTSDRPAGFYDSLFRVEGYGDLSVSVLRNEDIYRTIAFCMAKQKYFPSQEGVEYVNNTDPSTWSWGRGDGTYVDAATVSAVRNIMYAYNFTFPHKLADYGLDGDSMSLYSATSVALWAVIEGFTPDDLIIQPEADEAEKSLAEKQLVLIKDLYAAKDSEVTYMEGATLQTVDNHQEVSDEIDITTEDVYQIDGEGYYYRSPLLSLRANQTDGVVFDGEDAYAYVVTVDGAPNGTLITDENSHVVADGTFGLNDTDGSDFYIYVPYDGNSGSLTVKTETTTFKRMDTELWTPTSSSGYQDIMTNRMADDYGEANVTLTWSGDDVTPPPTEPPIDPDKYLGSLTINKTAQTVSGVEKVTTQYGDLYTFQTTEQPLQNAAFDIYVNTTFTDANDVDYIKGEKLTQNPIYTSSQGRIVIEGLPMAQNGETEYRIEEVVIPHGYYAEETSTYVTVNPSNVEAEVNIVNTPLKLSFSIPKVNDEGENVEGAVFGLYTTEDVKGVPTDALVAILTSDENGNISLSSDTFLPIDTEYALKELKAPDGYNLNPSVYTVTIDSEGNGIVEFNGEPVDHIINHEIKHGQIEITKVDATDPINTKPMSDVEFTLYKNGEEVERKTTDGNGKVVFENLIEGFDYTVSETVPDSYEVSDDLNDTYRITDQNQTIYITVENVKIEEEPIVGSLTIHKVDATNPAEKIPMENVKFTLFDGETEVASGTTDKDGNLRFDNLNEGVEYTVVETIPDGYMETSPIEPFIITKDNTVIEIEVENVQRQISATGSITVHKIDATIEGEEKPLEGVWFDLYHKESGEIIASAQTDVNGDVTFDGLSHDIEYEVKERTPIGYKEAEPIDTITLNSGEAKEIIVENFKDEKGSIMIHKVDADNDNAPLSGVKFSLWNGDEKISEGETNEFGTLTFRNLNLDITYTVKEDEPLHGYYITEAIDPITLNNENKDVEITVSNALIRGNINITKVDKDTESALSGAIFSLYAYEDTDFSDPIMEVTTNDDGKASFEGLTLGRYVVVETEAPNGYAKSNKLYNVNFSDIENGRTVEITVENEKTSAQIKVIKVDSADHETPVEGATYGLYDDNGELIKEGVTDENGEIDFGTVDTDATYSVKEIKAAIDYKLDNKTYTIITNDKDKTVYELTVEDDPIFGSIEIKKVDADDDDTVLKGAVFALYNSKGDKVGEVTTDKYGEASFVNLRMGNYTLKEMKAPNGYQLIDKEYKITVDALRKGTVTLTIENKEEEKTDPTPTPSATPTVPNITPPKIGTGEMGMIIGLPIAAVVIGGSLIGRYYWKKRNGLKDSDDASTKNETVEEVSTEESKAAEMSTDESKADKIKEKDPTKEDID